jgi:hypothetical protein
MADRYWDGGNCDDTNNWYDVATGGSPGASLPTSADNVYPRTTPSSSTFTINATMNCLDFDFSGATNNPTLAGSSPCYVYGNLTFAQNMQTTHSHGFRPCGLCNLTTNGLTLSSYIYIESQFAVVTLLDDLNTVNTNGIYLMKGTLNTNGKSVSCKRFEGSWATTRTLILGASIITCSGNWTFTNITGLTFGAGTSTIIMTGNTKTFAGGGLTYNNVRFSGTPTTVTGANTFNTLTVDSGKTCILPANTTQTASALSWDGATIQSSTAGTAATVSVASGTVEMNWGSLKDIAAEGGATFNAVNVTNVSGNDGWNWSITKNKIPMSMGMGM